MSGLANALKRKFSSPREVMRRLGIDESFLNERQDEGTREAERMHDKPLTNLRSAIDALLKEHADDTDPFVEKIRGLMNAGGSRGEEDDRFERLHEYLRKNSELSEDEIEGAKAEFAKDVRRRRANGKDRLPRNHMRVRDTVFGGARRDGESPEEQIHRESSDNFLTDHGNDSRRSWGANDSRSEIAKIHELCKRFGPEAGYAPERYRHAHDSSGRRVRASTEADKARFYRMFPNAARLEGETRDWSRRGLYEV